MSFHTTWICRFCGFQRSSIAGSRFVLRRGIKVRKCAECAKAESKKILDNAIAAAQADAIEQARIVGMGGEREIDLRQKLDIVSSLLREAAGRMSYGHWSTEFRARVEKSLKTKALKP